MFNWLQFGAFVSQKQSQKSRNIMMMGHANSHHLLVLSVTASNLKE